MDHVNPLKYKCKKKKITYFSNFVSNDKIVRTSSERIFDCTVQMGQHMLIVIF